MRREVRILGRAAMQRATRGRIVWRGTRARRRVALTFDDGPDDLTPRYLDALARLEVRATFFLLGRFVHARPGSVAAYLRAGHQVCGHGYEHARFTRITPVRLRTELRRTRRMIAEAPHAHWVRPPHGSLGPIDAVTMLASGYTVAMWTLDSGDHESIAPDEIVHRCRPGRVGPGDVVLLHEGQERTLAALPALVGRLRDAGFELVTMAELIDG